MIDLHCHLLPELDDGARDAQMAYAMARMAVADGITHVACTPHILPGVYPNSGPVIRQRVEALQRAFKENDIPLTLTTGADNHITPDFVAGLRAGKLLALGDTRYVLVEPPHQVAPPRLEQLFFTISAAGYVPILTHPERLAWVPARYDLIRRLAAAGVWMQITAGSLTGAFGKNARYWAEKMLSEGLVHILATDAHDTERRVPILSQARHLAAARVGENEAQHLVMTRPAGVLADVPAGSLPVPANILA